MSLNQDLTLESKVEYRKNPFGNLSVNGIAPNNRLIPGSETQVRLAAAEYITSGENDYVGNTVFFEDRGNKQLDFDFSPVASLDGTLAVEYFLDSFRAPSTMDFSEARAAIQSAAATWENASCSDLGIVQTDDIPLPIGIVAAQLGFPSIAGYVAEVHHHGWMPAGFFDFLAPDGSQFILGVTFTFLLIDQDGEYIDTNGDGKFDVAFREIYYNDNFIWGNGTTGVDVETIALHEMGHGLSQAHFGKAFRPASGSVKFAPRAVMNAAYSGVQRQITGTDLGGHCSIWGSWPNK